MRRLVICILLFTLSVNCNFATALVKAGSSCSKIGAKATVSGKKYTCIKSGKTLIWNKGVNVKKESSIIQGVCPPTNAGDKTEISQLRANALISMSEDLAQQCAASLDWEYRVGERDGEPLALTMDYDSTRVTVVIKAGVILSVQVG
jgi:hypothetical protein